MQAGGRVLLISEAAVYKVFRFVRRPCLAGQPQPPAVPSVVSLFAVTKGWACTRKCCGEKLSGRSGEGGEKGGAKKAHC